MILSNTRVVRLVLLNVAHPDDILPGYVGNTLGHCDCEGNILVVDVTGFNDWSATRGRIRT